MSFKIDRGLFKFDFIDHHAILGIAVDADAKDIRKRYLKIARNLHPDSCAAKSDADKHLANQLLSKLVNPAYEKISQDRDRAEYLVLLNQMGKRLVQESASIELNTELAKQLAQTPNIDHIYKSSLQKLAETQYNSFDQVLPIIAQLSELNLVYLMRKGGKAFSAPPPPPPPPPVDNKRKDAPPPPPQPQREEESRLAQYFRRAQTLMDKNNFAGARVELQEALKIEPNNSRCHSMVGVIYFKQSQLKMAKIHFDRALALNPNDKTALEGKRRVEQQLGQQPAPPNAPKSGSGKPQDNKSSGGGMFGGLFGGKKK